MTPEQVGWVDLSPASHELDHGTPESEWRVTADKRVARMALRAWRRGRRYVRICLVDVEQETYANLKKDRETKLFVVHHGWLGKKNTDTIDSHSDTLEEAHERAAHVMLIGGSL